MSRFSTPGDHAADTREAARAFEEALLCLDRSAAEHLLRREASGAAGFAGVERLVTESLGRIGEKWERGEAALSQIFMGGRICEELVDALLPPGGAARQPQPRTAIAVLEDHHALGKRIVYSCLRASGFELVDFGVGVTVDDALTRCRADGIELLLLSTLMLPAALRVKELTRRLREEPLPVRVVVGGAPFLFDEQLWREVGAHAMGRSAADAITLVRAAASPRP